jgi:hypothetical protein
MSGESERSFGRIGIFLALVGLALNPIIIGYCFAPDGKITSGGWNIFIILFELLLVIGGLAVWRKRKTLDRKTLLFGAITTLITLAAIETGLHVLQHLIRGNDFRMIDWRLKSSVYQHKSWADSLFTEYASLQVDFEPFIGWRTREITGTYIVVDSSGMRRTIQSGMNPPADSSCSLYCFGGSTMFGSYVRDGATIPSFLASALSGEGVPCTVFNYGDQAFTFEQEIIRLTLLLRDGRRPKSVLFYDGVNEVFPRYYAQQLLASGPLSPLYKTAELMKQSFPRRLGVVTRDYLEGNLLLFEASDRLAALLFGTAPSKYGRKNLGNAGLEALSAAIVADYKTSYDLLLRLASSYHFKLFCFLQPVIFTRDHPTAEELDGDRHVRDEEIKKLYLDTYALLKQTPLPDFYDLSGALNDVQGTYYVDFCHLSEEGNRIVAVKMAKNILNESNGKP